MVMSRKQFGVLILVMLAYLISVLVTTIILPDNVLHLTYGEFIQSIVKYFSLGVLGIFSAYLINIVEK